MSNELMTVIDNLPAELKLMMDASIAHDLEALGTKMLRLPKVKIGHANQTISLPNGELAREIDCFVVSSAHFMELYEKKEFGSDDEESKIPICAAINDFKGFRYGDCNQCPKFEWKPNPRNPEKQLRECASSFRLLIAIKGMKTPVEIKIPQTSSPVYAKATKEAMSAKSLPTVLMNLKITLTGKKEGNQEWSMFDFKYTAMEADTPEDFNKKVVQRLELQKKYMTYFKDVYGAANMINAMQDHDGAEKRTLQPVNDAPLTENATTSKTRKSTQSRRSVAAEAEFTPGEDEPAPEADAEFTSEAGTDTDLDSVDM